MRYAACLLASLLVASCATPEPRVVVREVKVPVSTPCTVRLPEKPAYAADAVNLDADIFTLVQAILVDRETRKAREAELEAAATACSDPPR